MNKLLYLSLTLLICSPGLSQTKPEKWGTVTKEELTMAYCSLDPSADAAVLNNYGHYYFGRHYYFSAQELRSFYHYHVRLKIYTEAGKKYATVTIPFRGYDEYEDVTEISGITYNLDENGKITKTKLKAKDAVWQRNGRNTWFCTFTLPNVKPGSVLEYSYKIPSLDFVKLRDWMFQKDIPILSSEMTLSTPNFFQYAFFSNVPLNQLAIKRSDHNQYIQFYNTNIYVNGPQIQLSARNIPAFKKEKMMPDSSRQILKGEFLLSFAITRPSEFTHINDYYLMPYLKPLLLSTTEDFYEIRERIYLNTEIIGGYKMIEGMNWESFTKKLSKSEEFGKTMLKAFECQHLIDSFRKIETGVKRMTAIYDYVKNYMRWNGEYRIFASKSLEKTFEKRSGYSSDINMLLINLLSRSGIPARPVLISTRSYGDVYKEVGFFRKFNHLLASVMIEGKRYLLDATQPERPVNWLSLDDLNGEGILVNIMEFEWVPLINHQISTTAVKETYSFMDGKTNLHVVVSENGYNAFEKSFKKKLNQLDINAYLAKDFKLNSITEEKNNSLNNAASWSVEISGEKTSETHADHLSVSLQPVFNVWDIELQEEERVHPVDFGFDQVIERKVTIPVPAGYKVSEIPTEEKLEMQNTMLVFSRKSKLVNDTLQLRYSLEINQSLIPAQYYKDLKRFFENVKEKNSENVIFTRIVE